MAKLIWIVDCSQDFTDRITRMDPVLLEQICHLYQTSPDLLIPLSGGHSNAVYRFPLPASRQVSPEGEHTNFGVLRVGVEDCPPAQTLGMLEWVHFISENGAPVASPIASSRGQFLERLDYAGKTYTITALTEAEGTLAERIPPTEWTDELFSAIGRAAGKLHAISKRYHPSQSALTRLQWFESYEIHDATVRLAATHDPAGEKLATLIQQLKLLPTESADFGLIHDDLHFANFLIHADGKVTIIDFDDCVYGWFSMDVSMALFDVLVLYNAPSVVHNQEFARRFMHHYLAGYRQENDLAPFWQEQIPHFLKLKEICVYAPLVGHPDIQLPDSWVGRFMRQRVERIAGAVPYVDIDFSTF